MDRKKLKKEVYKFKIIREIEKNISIFVSIPKKNFKISVNDILMHEHFLLASCLSFVKYKMCLHDSILGSSIFCITSVCFLCLRLFVNYLI